MGSPRLRLLCLLVALMLLSPFLAHLIALRVLFDAALFLALAGALEVSQASKRHVRACLLVGAAWLALSTAASIYGAEGGLGVAYSLFTVVFYTLSVAIILKGIVLEREVSMDAMAGAVAVYMLIALLFGSLYRNLDELVPGSFMRAFPPGEIHPATPRDLMYLSFTALTPLKGGHVEAVSVWAEVLLILEAFLGVFYLALLISRLVQLYENRGR